MIIGQCQGCDFLFTQLRPTRRGRTRYLVTPNGQHLRAVSGRAIKVAHIRDDDSICGEVLFFGGSSGHFDELISERQLEVRDSANRGLDAAIERIRIERRERIGEEISPAQYLESLA